MALFKNLLLTYVINKFDKDYLVLHCSREDFVKAPFDGDITNKNGELILKKDKFELYISHITPLKDGFVKAGEKIATPVVDSLDGRKVAYIKVKLYKDKLPQDIIKYLNFKDDNVDIVKPSFEIKTMTEEEVDEVKKMVDEIKETEVTEEKPKSTPKKTSSKSTKKSTKKNNKKK